MITMEMGASLLEKWPHLVPLTTLVLVPFIASKNVAILKALNLTEKKFQPVTVNHFFNAPHRATLSRTVNLSTLTVGAFGPT